MFAILKSLDISKSLKINPIEIFESEPAKQYNLRLEYHSLPFREPWEDYIPP